MNSSGILDWFYIIPILAVLIIVHELGHFFAARKCGAKVEEFGIGLPPRLFGFVRKDVLWSINAIPFGGFVRVKGEDGKNLEPDSMNAQPPLERLFFLSAGIMMNILLAVVLMILVIGFKGVPHYNTYIADVAPGSPAAKAGWNGGDRIVAIDGQEMETIEEVIANTRSHAGEPVTVTLERRGNLVDTTLVPRQDPPKGEGRIGVGLRQISEGEVFAEIIGSVSAVAAAGIQPGDRIIEINGREVTDPYVLSVEMERYVGAKVPVTILRDGVAIETAIAVPRPQTGTSINEVAGFDQVRLNTIFESVPPLQVVPRGFEEAYNTTVMMLKGVKELFSSRENLSQVAGPVGMAQLTSEIVKESTLPLWVTLGNFAILLSLNLAFLNLLPIPGLDGGRMVFVILEMLRGGKRLAPEREGMVHLAGIVLLIGLMFVIAFSDIRRIVNGDSFLR